MNPNEPTPPWLRAYTKLVAAATLFLIFAGAMVTSTGSGLAVPDWPLSYGMLFPPMVGGIFYEHGHRMIAATVGLLTVIQALLLWRHEPKRFVRRLGWVAVGAVIAQGLLGGLTVLFLLPPAISIGHAALAELFLCLNVAIAFFTSVAYGRLGERRGTEPPAAALTALPVVVFVQMLAGALMRHLGAGLAIPDFPLSFGRIVPPLTTLPVAVNFAHRVGALVVLVAVYAAAKPLLDLRRPLRGMFGLIAGVVSLQVTLGAFTVFSQKNPVITSLHVVTGALMLGVSVLALLAHRTISAKPEPRQLAPIGRKVEA